MSPELTAGVTAGSDVDGIRAARVTLREYGT